MKLVTFTSGLRLNLDFVTKISVSGTVITFNLFDGTTETFDALNTSLVLSQINRFTNGITCNCVGTLTWVSVVPNTDVVNATGSCIITGTGFLGAGFNEITFYDGATYYSAAFFIDTDTQITIERLTDFSSNIGTYTIYYSTNGGITRTSTALTFEITP